MKKYRVGSNILHLNNCKDADYVILSDIYGDYKMIFDLETKEDLIYISENYLTSLLNFEIKRSKLLIYNYQYDSELIGKEFPIEYHILDYKEALIDFLNFVVEKGLFNFNKMITCNGKYCSRVIYHIAYNVFILQNNSVTLTDEQLSIVQQIHDVLMPIDYIDTLISMIYELKSPNLSISMPI